MSTAKSRPAPVAAPGGAPVAEASIDSSLASAAEDHSLVSVPAADRKSGWQLSLSPMSVATALVIFAIAGFTVVLAGFGLGMLAGVTVAVIGVLLGRALGQMAYQTGMSSTLTARFFGFGLRGSAAGSVIFAVMILGFLAVESALLYEGTLLAFHWSDTWLTKIVIYGLLAILWTALAIFGLKLALRATGVLIVVTLVVAVYMVFHIYAAGDASMSTVFGYHGIVPGGWWPRLEAALGLMGATGGTIALVTTDFARYCRTGRDVTILSISGPLMQNIVMTVLGSLVVIGGMPEVVKYLVANNSGMTAEQAGQVGTGYVMGNTGAFFVIFAGWLGFVTIYAAQAKAQAINAYSGSLSLVNLVDVLFGRKPGRAVMVVVANVIALVMISAGILDSFNKYLAHLGACTFAMCGVMVADFYLVRGRRFEMHRERLEMWNWAGLISLAVAAAVGVFLIATDTFPLGFFVSFVVAVVLYPVLRAVLPEGTGTSFADEADALDEAV
ncbi:purine-cytosine permease family protein [Flexivirga sp.]|uniref:purine-cytosine permease family protein n=1 Tax=Flexivirga sp. TaxID=1962927 RepID=UPI003F7E089A